MCEKCPIDQRYPYYGFPVTPDSRKLRDGAERYREIAIRCFVAESDCADVKRADALWREMCRAGDEARFLCSSNQFFISDYKDVDKIPDNKPFKPLTFVTEVKWNDGKTYYVFAPHADAPGRNGLFFIREPYIEDVFKRINATVDVYVLDNKLTFSPDCLTINDGRRVPFRWDGEYTYRLRKTYFAGRSPYAFIRLLVQPWWNARTHAALTGIGYIKAGVANA